MSKARTTLILLSILLALIISLPLTFPFGLFIPDCEKKLGELLQGQVSVGAIGFELDPGPVLVLSNLHIDGAENAAIAKVKIPFSFQNLKNWGRSFQLVRTENAQLSRAFALSLPDRIHPGQEGLHIKQLDMRQTTVKLEKNTLGPVDATLHFNANGRIEVLTLADALNRAQLRITPQADKRFQLELTARGWDMPIGQPVKFEYLSIKGNADQDGLTLDDIRADLYGGSATGVARLDWRKNWVLSGEVNSKNIQSEPFLKLYSPVTYFSGRISSRSTFRFEANEYKDLFHAPQLQGSFAALDGRVHNFDLIAPLKSQTPNVVRHGGQTDFNLLNGGFSYSGGELRLRGIKLDDGKLRANGDLLIKQGTLNGSVYTQLSSGVLSVAAPLSISGKLESPELRSTGATRNRSPLADEAETTSAN